MRGNVIDMAVGVVIGGAFPASSTASLTTFDACCRRIDSQCRFRDAWHGVKPAVYPEQVTSSRSRRSEIQ